LPNFLLQTKAIMSQALLTQPIPISPLLSVNSDDDFIYVYNAQGRQIVEINIHLLSEGILNDTWYGVVFDEEYIAFLDGIYYEIFGSIKFTKKLCNIKNLEGSFDGINEWIYKIYHPKFISNGLKYNALVKPEELCAQLSLEFYMEKINNLTLESQTFDSQEDALAWLGSKN
jgi:hypothetical protein